MNKFAEFIVKKRWWVLLIWLVASALIIGFAPKLSSVQSNDQSGFLPKDYESIQAMNVAKQISSDTQNPTDIIVFKSNNDQIFSDADLQKIDQTISNLNSQKLSRVEIIATSPQP